MNDLKEIRKKLDSIESTDYAQLSEAWLSNQLAWLLDPKGNHGLGVRFINDFIKLIAKKRSSGKYKRGAKTFKSGRAKPGIAVSQFSLKNASPIRELYLSRTSEKDDDGILFADLVLMDLDSSENLIVVIENKLFGVNQVGQLEKYRSRTKTKFTRCKAREYVYLTLGGDAPRNYSNSQQEAKEYSHWINLSWIKDILMILISYKLRGKSDVVKPLRDKLSRLDKLSARSQFPDYSFFRKGLLKSLSTCLLEELNRLNSQETSKWKKSKSSAKEIHLHYTRHPARRLEIKQLPNLCISVQGYNGKKPISDKLYLPANVSVGQLFNLIDLFAREIYHSYFGEEVMTYLSNRRRKTSTISEEKLIAAPLFDLVHKHYDTLRILSLVKS